MAFGRVGQDASPALGVDSRAAAEIAHVLRRTSFGPAPGDVGRALEHHGSAAALVDAQLAAPPLAFDPPADIDRGFDGAADAVTDADRLVGWWLERMRRPDAGLHDRMIWFWHTHFTTSVDKAPTIACWRQLRALHEHAMGSFRNLLRALLDDIALAVYLDADGSLTANPNENLARELLELFTLGRGNYTQQDVRSVARLLAGRSLDWESGRLQVDSEQRSARDVTLFGVDGYEGLDGVVDAILAQPACAEFVVGRLWPYLIGGDPSGDIISAWAAGFRESAFDLSALVATMIRSDEFAAARLSRPRSSLEWFITSTSATGHDEYGVWDLAVLGQIPWHPPDVAGWPGVTRWTSPTQALARGTYLTWFEPHAAEELARTGAGQRGGDDLVETVLVHCGLHEVSGPTRHALRALAAELLPADDADPTPTITAVLRAALLTPEYALT